MIKKNFLILFLFINLFFITFSQANIYIEATVDDKIITNYDVKKESEYLKILNPNLQQLNNQKILDLARISLINEIVKKKEIIKFIDFDKDNAFIESYLKNLYLKLNYTNEEEFKDILSKNDNYSLGEIKEKIKIELFWNELIYKKYNKQVKIDEKKLKTKVENLVSNKQKKYLLSEIIFSKKKDISLETLKDQIELSINEIGFNNTANIYSISESSKLGGKLGWVNENSLSQQLFDKLKNMKEGENTGAIQIGNNFLILKIDQIKEDEIVLNKKEELSKLIKSETNKQLNQFSRIYFDKSKMNYDIKEK